MKIGNSVKSVGGPPSASRKGAAQPAAGGASSSPPAAAGSSSAAAGNASAAASSEVELSPLAARLQEISGNLANTPVVDAGRVSEIKQAIADGRFKMDASKIADGLIASVRQMISAQR